jgi:hypothetical protein
MPNEGEPRMMTTAEAAAYLRCHVDSLRVWRHRPQHRNPLPARKAGHRWLYAERELLMWAEREAHIAGASREAGVA